MANGDQNINRNVRRLNWRQILVHFLAAWLLTYASELFGYFRNIPFMEVLMKRDSNFTFQYIKSKNLGTTDIYSYALFVNEVWLIGLLLAFLISLNLSLKRRWWWGNSLIVIILVYFIKFAYNHFIGNHTGKWFSTISNFPIHPSVDAFVVVGGLSIIGGFWLFFSRKVAASIERANKL
ncbi:MAG TPA: hypothetical protein VGN00_04150 [Puia sp.]